MWISGDGIVNINMWGDPASALPPALIGFLDSLDGAARRDLIVALGASSERAADSIIAFKSTTSASAEKSFERVWMPARTTETLEGHSVPQLVAQLDLLDLRWRLDGIGVIESYLDD